MTDEGSGAVSRRGVLRAIAGSAAVAATSAAAGPAAAQSTEFDGWFTGDAMGGATDNFDGSVADMTGQSEVTVEVGADGNGGTFAFAPPAVRVSPGTTVTFTWTSNTHNIIVESQPDGAGWEGVEAIENEGFETTHTFETEGTYKYFCNPHLGQGMKGAIVVGGSQDGGGGDGGGDGGDGGGGGGGGATWTVDMTDENVFEPEEIVIRPGDTIVWENVGSADHSITAYEADIPDGAEYWASGGFDGEDAARDAWPDGAVGGGETYEHTFETEGVHEYFCIPHESVGMVGTVEVDPDGPTPTPTPEPAAPALPPTAKAIGVAAGAAMASTLGLAYAFMKYGGSGGE